MICTPISVQNSTIITPNIQPNGSVPINNNTTTIQNSTIHED